VVCAVAGACLLGAVSTASASKLYVDPSGTLRFAAGAGEVNRVDATDLGTGGFTVVTDPGSSIHPGLGCVSVTAHQGRCALPASVDQDMRIDLADRDGQRLHVRRRVDCDQRRRRRRHDRRPPAVRKPT
jgi:hypothetical protein